MDKRHSYCQRKGRELQFDHRLLNQAAPFFDLDDRLLLLLKLQTLEEVVTGENPRTLPTVRHLKALDAESPPTWRSRALIAVEHPQELCEKSRYR